VIRVAVVDDHPVTRYGLERILTGTEMTVVAMVGEVAELPSDGVDVVVLDLYLNSGRPSLDAVEQLSERCPVLVMSASRNPGDVLAVLQHGASGFVAKHDDDEAVRAAVRSVGRGEFHFTSALADILQAELARLTGPQQPAAPRLSPREDEVLTLIARGFTHGQIATRLNLKAGTVETYVARIRDKLGLGNKAELALAALKRRLERPHEGPV
jgi:DNA-binding NarL/FixJ family response regulator